MGEVSPPPFSEPPSFFVFFLIPQIIEFTPPPPLHFKILDSPFNTCKSGADFEKCVSLGKIGYSWKNVSHLELWVAFRKWITLIKMDHTWKNVLPLEK